MDHEALKVAALDGQWVEYKGVNEFEFDKSKINKSQKCFMTITDSNLKIPQVTNIQEIIINLNNMIKVNKIDIKYYSKYIFGNLYQIALDENCGNSLLGILSCSNVAFILNQLNTEICFNLFDFLTLTEITKNIVIRVYSLMNITNRSYLLDKVLKISTQLCEFNKTGLSSIKSILEKATSKEEQKIIFNQIGSKMKEYVSKEELISVIEIVLSRIKEPYLLKMQIEIILILL